MKKLNLPITKEKSPSAKSLSMDDYLMFVMFNLKYTSDVKAIRRQKKISAVNARFKLS